MSDVLQQRQLQQPGPRQPDPSQRDGAAPDAVRIDRVPAPDALAAGWPMFRAAAQLETVHWLIQALGAAEPLAAVTGEAGLGKTVAAAAAASQLTARGYLVISAAAPFAGPLELQALLAEGLGLPRSPHTTPVAIAAALQARGTASGRARPAVLMLDGAERLSSLVLQYLWLMHRLCGGGRALQMVFVGRPAFWGHIETPELAELERAIAVRTVLPPLSDDESLAYLQHRLENFGVEPAAVPRKLGPAVMALAQGVPSRINVIADAVVAREPRRLLLTRKVIDAATATLSGDPASAEEGVNRRPLIGFAVAGAGLVAMLAAWGGWAWLAPGRPAMPARTAQVSPPALPTLSPPVQAASPPAPKLPVPPHTPAPPQPLPPQPASRNAVLPAPELAAPELAAPELAAPELAAPEPAMPEPAMPEPAMPEPAMPEPAMPEPAVSEPATLEPAVPGPAAPQAPEATPSVGVAAPAAAIRPPAATPSAATPSAATLSAATPSAATPSAVTPPVTVLPDAAMPRIIVQYPAADPGVAAHAISVVAILRARGLAVADPVAVAGAARSTTVEYYFVEDQAEATQLARELGGSVSAGRIGGRNPDAPPPPGTVRVLLSSRAAAGNVSMPESVPTPAVAPEGADAPSPASQEPP